MKILIAPDSFKGSLSAVSVAETIGKSFQKVLAKAEIILAPMSDGGEGFLDCILYQDTGYYIEKAVVSDPLGNKIKAKYLIHQDTAIIEMAKASGLSLIPPSLRNPLQASTFGTGELIMHALNQGCKRFIIGLGGSGTCDGGMGALSAFGIRFYDKENKLLDPNGVHLSHIATIDTQHFDKRLGLAEFILAHDVNNPFLGPQGAIFYAAQKGADSLQMETLSTGFKHFVTCLQHHIQHPNIGTIPGTGAAGGLSLGLFAFLNARFIPGAKVMIDMLHLAETMQGVSLVITGEGQIDAQTLYGKTPIAVAQLAKSNGIPVVAIVGKIGPEVEAIYKAGIDAVFSICDGPRSDDFCRTQAKILLTQTSINIARFALALALK